MCDLLTLYMLCSYQGAGRKIVSRSHTAMDSSTVLVGDSSSGLEQDHLVNIKDQYRLHYSKIYNEIQKQHATSGN